MCEAKSDAIVNDTENVPCVLCPYASPPSLFPPHFLLVQNSMLHPPEFCRAYRQNITCITRTHSTYIHICYICVSVNMTVAYTCGVCVFTLSTVHVKGTNRQLACARVLALEWNACLLIQSLGGWGGGMAGCSNNNNNNSETTAPNMDQREQQQQQQQQPSRLQKSGACA